MAELFDEITLGGITGKNRIMMAPMTRSRADVRGCVPDFTAEYYAQRSGAGLLITEGTQPSFEGQGYARTPGIHTEDQIAAWRRVTDAVHAEGGKIVVQIMHVGRIAHPLNRQTDAQPIAPSAIAPANTPMYTDQEGMQPIPTPRALDPGEIPDVVAEYGASAKAADQAGFDGVELHAASGYLPMQFLSTGTNQRTDGYGGSVANRGRFIMEALEAMSAVIGSERVGIKLSPAMSFNDCTDADPVGTYSYLVQQLSDLGLAYLHVGKFTEDFDVHGTLRPLYSGVYLAGGGLRSAQDGEALLKGGVADGTVWGTRFLANPDLPLRLERDGPYTEPDPSTFYTPGRTGYTDYPTLAQSG